MFILKLKFAISHSNYQQSSWFVIDTILTRQSLHELTRRKLFNSLTCSVQLSDVVSLTFAPISLAKSSVQEIWYRRMRIESSVLMYYHQKAVTILDLYHECYRVTLSHIKPHCRKFDISTHTYWRLYTDMFLYTIYLEELFLLVRI